MDSTSSSCNARDSTTPNDITNNHQRSLRPRKAPVKAIHFEGDGSAAEQSFRQERKPIKNCELAKGEHDTDTTTFSDPPTKRPRVALGTRALECKQNNSQEALPQGLAAVCPVPLPLLYGCCDNLQFDTQKDELVTRSIETQTSASPFNYNSKFVGNCSYAMQPEEDSNQLGPLCFSTCEEIHPNQPT